MAKDRPSRPRPLMFWFTPITRSPAQGSACKDLRRNGQRPAIVPEATYVLVYAHNAFASPEAGLAHAHQKSASFSSRRLLSFYYMFSA
ncbi:Malolactic regulator [Lacticaseibacillus rhamnosus]|uniref:Malolactic regulator n=2 Tax=Lacticaseibacillus rhamnosus TaxID=47715 RepID=A0AAX0JZK6_LACRH|nr:Malolactic regulator [Lacticaseibacillus rhamnosus]ASY48459.1 hypothetical protein N507_1283 [Lacticaseibacillus rhamnosus DSM 14870]EKS50348.1 Malolactic regulator [Lacticaseibacillus rhamnosus LRHMDP3]CAR88428.1 Putative protein without homology [Lacticaseibacillus rhamnosus GG]ART97339.1 Malolactic regulator [Lacticaseibacillus rhamnosus]